MSSKKMTFSVVITLIFAVATAAVTIAGTHLLRADEPAGKAFSRLFHSSDPRKVEFVEIKNMVITLKNAGNKEHYLLLEVSLATSDPEKKKTSEEMQPAIRGATIELLSDMDYDEVRGMKSDVLHDKLKEAYNDKFNRLRISVPFDDVIISRLVFQ